MNFKSLNQSSRPNSQMNNISKKLTHQKEKEKQTQEISSSSSSQLSQLKHTISDMEIGEKFQELNDEQLAIKFKQDAYKFASNF